jgi:hypothetical protein
LLIAENDRTSSQSREFVVAPKQFFYWLLLSIAVACTAPEQVEPVRLSGDGGYSSQSGNVNQMGVSDKQAHEMVPGQVLVRFREGTDPRAIERIQGEAGARILKAVSGNALFLMEIMDGSSVEDAVRRLNAYPEILYAEPNYGRGLKSN